MIGAVTDGILSSRNLVDAKTGNAAVYRELMLTWSWSWVNNSMYPIEWTSLQENDLFWKVDEGLMMQGDHSVLRNCHSLNERAMVERS